MAIQFAALVYISRTDGGNACRSAAYNERSDIRCQRTGERFYFAHRGPTLHHEVLLPTGADSKFLDPTVLWNEAQAMEKRRDSQEAKHLLLALPSNPGLTLDDWTVMCREFIEEHFISKGVAAQLDIHDPHDGDRSEIDPAYGADSVHLNYHAHVLITTRRIEGSAFATHKARDLDPEVRTMQGKGTFVTEADRWGEIWRDYQNSYFERQGLEIRVDETGFVPQRHEGPVRLRTVPDDSLRRLDAARQANIAMARDPVEVLKKLTQKNATFTELDIVRHIKKFIPDPAERREIREAVLARPEVVPLYGWDTGEFVGRYTTKEVRTAEIGAVETAKRVARSHRPPDRHMAQEIAEQHTLDEEQMAAFVKGTGTDGLVVIEGVAGAGKSHGLNAIREAHEAAGWHVVGIAPTNQVAANLRQLGFRYANTAHRELYYQERGGTHAIPRWDRDTLVIVEEAAMLDTNIYGRLMRQAADKGAKIILAGDDRQLASVERGGLFTQFKERHGSAMISTVRRQRADWQREASKDFSEGRMEEGLRAYAEHGHIHWSQEIDESRDRLLSDWDQDSRERPDVDRFVYASTNAEVNRLNRAIHDIRVRRGEVENQLEVETVKGKMVIGTGDRIQFHGNDRRRGIINGAHGTIAGIDGTLVTVDAEICGRVTFDTREFNEYALGYAGTVYRGQGKTQTEVYALYDHIWAWNSRTAYVGMTRHSDRVELYVSRDLADSEWVLAAQMEHKFHDGASLEWATRAEIIGHGRQPHEREPGTRESATPEAASPRDEMDRLRRIDLPTYAQDVHGFTVQPHPSGDDTRSLLTRPHAQLADERLEARIADDGHWIWRDLDDRRHFGDIFDLARHEGAPNLAAALEAVSAYDESMRTTNARQRQAEEKARIEIDAADPEERALKEAGAEVERQREIAGATVEDQRDAAVAAEEDRVKAIQEEAARVTRLTQEAAAARTAEEAVLLTFDRASPLGQYPDLVQAYIRTQTQLADDRVPEQAAEQARQQTTPPEDRPPERQAEPETAQSTPRATHDRMAPTFAAVGTPKPAQLRYAEAMGARFTATSPISSLAEASLREAAAFQRDQRELDQRIAAEYDPARRDALMLRRDIEHAEHMAQAYDRIALLTRAAGTRVFENRADDREPANKAKLYKEHAQEARGFWTEFGKEHPDLYASLTPGREQAQQQAREAFVLNQERIPELFAQAQEHATGFPDLAQQQAPGPPAAERSATAERSAMRCLNLADYLRDQHGFELDWRNPEHTRAVLEKGDQEFAVYQEADGTWTYQSLHSRVDRGDILDFDVQHAGKSFDQAREALRPRLAAVERDQGPLDRHLAETRERLKQLDQEQERGLGRELGGREIDDR